LRPHLTRFGSLVHTKLLRLPRASFFDARWQGAAGSDLRTGLNVRSLLAALERNEALVILADGRAARALYPIPVGGVDVYFAPGSVSLARQTGAALLPAFVVDEPEQKGPSTLRLVIHPPLELQVTGDRNADLRANLQQFASVYEQQMRTHPHNFHWSWVRNGVLDRPD
jgi:KDO2-lipid IV(A) lauroyltransferase